MFSFFKKKEKLQFKLMHYEGLKSFMQDFPCEAELDVDGVVFTSGNNTARLKFEQLICVDYMKEIHFMGKYHNNPVSTAKSGVKWFSVITYKSSDGQTKYLAFWSVSSDGFDFIEKIKSKIPAMEINL